MHARPGRLLQSSVPITFAMPVHWPQVQKKMNNETNETSFAPWLKCMHFAINATNNENAIVKNFVHSDETMIYRTVLQRAFLIENLQCCNGAQNCTETLLHTVFDWRSMILIGMSKSLVPPGSHQPTLC